MLILIIVIVTIAVSSTAYKMQYPPICISSTRLLHSPSSDQVRLSRDGKTMLALLATTMSTFGIYSGVKFSDDENALRMFKRRVFMQYTGMNTLEVGFGESTGANFEFYPDGISLNGIDPYTISNKASSDAVLKYKVEKSIALTLQKSACEMLPFKDKSFDCVVSTLVFCSVDNPAKCAREILRILKPGGYFIVQEHIKGEHNSALAFQQELFEPLQEGNLLSLLFSLSKTL